ncbi:DNA cytosine methyltransferase [Halobacterium sp. KA-6]|uniref:DNA cytosine methyltransferase n=1 Tax=Halobacterium sp. KA-6 TaxID=2896368 RepID=UPI001E4902CE|nr:DNA cytosine methyltransferase [Halobacterium sp. KA-6]MCD2201841.1 DNA cytosine methyltransferase [Halobacterium sp. KA-6]
MLSPSDSRSPGQFRNEWQAESARQQSFSDDYLFVAPIAKQRQMSGNAVPLLGRAVAEAIAKEILPA